MDTVKPLTRRYNGYYRSAIGTPDPELTQTGPGTPAGEYFRRFWQPVAMTEQVGDLPLALEILGEELVLFRDLSGQLGLLHKYCSHRRASLEYGIISENGIRCCYHGWLFDVDGTILEVPGEPADSPIPRRLCHGAYPVKEFNGLVFAWMGPPDDMPEFPLFDTLAQANNDLAVQLAAGSRKPDGSVPQRFFAYAGITRSFQPGLGRTASS